MVNMTTQPDEQDHWRDDAARPAGERVVAKGLAWLFRRQCGQGRPVS
jgi:hypothetical protein